MATIKLKRGTSAPTTSNIVDGEIAVDKSSQKLYIRDGSTIKEIGRRDSVPLSGGTMTGNLVVPNVSITSTNWFGFGDYGERITGSNAAGTLTFLTDATTALQLDSSQNASFAANVDATGIFKVGTYAAAQLKVSGYSSSYRSIMLGAPDNNGGSVSLAVDVSTIAGSNFAGQNVAFIGKNGLLFPNAAADNWIGGIARGASSDVIHVGPATTSGITSGPLTLTSTNVGVGTSSPAQKVDISGGGLQILGNISTPASGTSSVLIDYYSGAARYWARGADGSTRGSHNFYVLENDGGGQLTALSLDSSANATFAGDVSIPVGNKLYLGGGSHTYISEDIDDRVRFFAGGTEFLRFTEDSSDITNLYTDLNIAGGLEIAHSSDNGFKVTATDTAGNTPFAAMRLDYDASGSDTLTADRAHIGLEIDVDSSASGGDTSNEHRLYGVWNHTKATGDSDLVYGGYFMAEAEQSAGTISQVYGLHGRAEVDVTGGAATTAYGLYGYATIKNDAGTGATNAYAVYGKTLLQAANVNDAGQLHGGYFEVEISDPGSGSVEIDKLYGVRVEIDNNDTGTAHLDIANTEGYLFYGNYAGTQPGNAYGVYIVDDVPSYFGGSATFAGNIVLGDGHTIGDDGDDNLVLTSSANENIMLDSGEGVYLDHGTSSTDSVYLRRAGSSYAYFRNSSDDLVIGPLGEDHNLFFQGNDGGSTINMLKLNAAQAGEATFNHNVGVGSGDISLGSTDIALQVGSSSYTTPTIQIRSGTSGTGKLWFGDNSGTDAGRYDGYIQYYHGDGTSNTREMRFGTAGTLALKLDSSQNATFAGSATATALTISASAGKLAFADDAGNYYIHQKDSTDGILLSGYYGVSLGYQGTKKLQVDSAGVDITGDATVSGGISVTGVSNVQNTFTIGGSGYGTLTYGTIGSGSAFGIRSGSSKDFSIGSGGSWDVLRLSAAGAATFSGKITATAAGTNSSLYALDLSRSGSGSSPDIWGTSNNLVLGTSASTAVLTLTSGNATFGGAVTISIPDDGGSPATTAILNLHGYEGRGAGIKIKDTVNNAGGGESDREWFVGSGYSQSGFSIGYASDGSQSSYLAQSKLAIGTDGNASFSNGVYVNGGSTNSGKADFAVNVGGGTGGTLAIAGDEVRIGNTDVNWNSKFYYDGTTRLDAWNTALEIKAYGGSTDREISLYPSDAGAAVKALGLTPDVVQMPRGYLEVGGSVASYGRIEVFGSSGAYIDLTANTAHGTDDYDSRIINDGTNTQLTSKTGYIDIHPQTGTTYIRHAGSVVFESTADGATIRDTSGSDTLLRLNGSDNAALAYMYANMSYNSSQGRMFLYSYHNGALYMVIGEDNGGTARTMFWADPDAYSYLYYNGSWKARTQSDGFQINGSLSYNSDRRLKKDITPISGALDAVLSLKGVNYTLIDSDTKHIGFVAQDIQADAPSWLTERVVVEPNVDDDDESAKNDGSIQDGESVEMLAVNYANMVALLTEAMKEQQTQIEALTKRIKELEDK